jgi:hypothetical protein
MVLVLTAAIVAAFAGSASTASASGVKATLDELSSQRYVKKKVIVTGDRGRGRHRGMDRGRGSNKTVIIKRGRGGGVTKKVIIR